ncbi:autotransporter domain-containing protein [Rhodoplanes elegans]|uniref:autotransporter domain-containing protein n=3 Tax=Rhodoplanes elegans TaxID=29408 RepID=UPI0014765750|nr:autotransporter domain-containing protein [Rhodoplanes elegans]
MSVPVLSVLFATTALVSPVVAADVTWTGPGTDWFSGTNWSGGQTPSTSDTAVVNGAVTATIAGQPASVDTVQLGTTATNASLAIVNAGGLITAGWDNIGKAVGATATVTVTGTGSTWTASSGILVGVEGTGRIDVSGGAMVTSSALHLGRLATGSGTVTVDASTWITNGSVSVGYEGTGSMTLSNRATASFGAFQIGMYSGASGTLQIESGATLTTSGASHVGNQANTTGTATITGAGSQWTSNGLLYLGLSGTGSLTVANGGTFSTVGMDIGRNTGAVGTLRIESGGSLTSTGVATVGYQGRGTVTVTGAGSSATFDALSLGYNGTGSLAVTDGATVTAKTLSAAEGTGGRADITVSGAGSRFTTTEGASVGNTAAGTPGTIAVQGGGTFATGYGLYLYGGSSVTVTGAGSQLLVGTRNPGTPSDFPQADGWLSISDASVTVANGARLEADGVYVQGAPGAGAASLTVTGRGTVMDGHLVIYVGGNGNGTAGDGTLTISDGATATATILGTGVDAGRTGRLLLTGAGSSLTTIPNGTYTGNAYAGSYGNGTIVVQDGAALSVANELRIAYAAGSTGKLLIGSEQGQAAAAPGTVTAAGGVVFGSGTGQLVFNHTSSNYIFAPSISGTGTIRALSGTTTLTGDSSGFSGTLEVAGGILNVAGAINAVTTVDSGAVLTGSGKVGGVDARTGATVSPGNSPGTLTVTGNYQQAAGSTYLAELVPGSTTSDLIAVTGTATLDSGAILRLAKYGAGNYSVDTRYTILTAAGGVTGTYLLTGDTAASAFYTWTVGYDPTSVYVAAVQTRAFTSAATTPNQIAVAGALQNLTTGQRLRSAVGSVATDAAARAAFDQISGEIHSSITGAMVEDSRFVRNAAVDRLRAASGRVGPGAASGFACGTPAAASAGAPTAAGCRTLAFWAQGYGTWGSSDGNGNAAGLSHDTGGLLVGADLPAFETWRLGVMAGYGHATYGVSDRNASGRSDNYSVGLYGGTQIGALGVRLGTAYTFSDVTTNRTVAVSGFYDTPTGRYDAYTAQAFADVGYQVVAGRMAFEPFAGLAHVKVGTERFTEQGGLAALTSSGVTPDVTVSTLGLRAATDFSVGATALTATGTLGWRHAFGDVGPISTVSLQGSAPFAVAGLPIARDVAIVEAGLSSAVAANTVLGLSYTGQFGDGTQSQGVRGSFSMRF